MPLAALPIALIASSAIGAGGAIASGVIGSHAASTAANQQATAENQALDFQKQEFATQQANVAPYQAAGTQSLAQLMESLKNGTFGIGSTADFKAPTLAEVQQTPGYQFALDQGTSAINRGQAAAGGAFTGGTLKALDQFGTGLANSTYSDAFSRALAGYQANLSNQAQQFNESLAPVTLGLNAANSINNTGTQVSQNVGQIMSNIGNANAAGTVGSANAITGAISGGTNSITQSLLLGQLFGNSASPSPVPTGWSGTPGNAIPPSASYVPPTPDYIPPPATYIPG